MPLFVPVLRLSMLFLNVYDSYKILKPPPPSPRNGGMPSQRALQQRKRNMKGCIAVWIVWCCFTMYERLAEGVISLFVPFYDEVKSLFLLFLIFTRARGAEPIFLHIIRPLLKPYTATLDILLDLVCMTGDIIFVLCTTPFRMIWNWWENSIFNLNIGTLDSEPSSAMDQSIISSTRVQATYPSPPAERGAAELPHRTGSIHQANRQSGFRSKDRRAASQGETRRIWNPPSTAYDDDDSNNSELRIQTASDRNSIPLKSAVIAGHQEIEEWREYPPFPSAYPATPLVVSSSLISAAVTSNHVTTEAKVLSDIPEGLSRQGFPKSLLPPRKPLDPDLDGGLSDDSSNIGVNSIANDDMSVDSVTESDEEDEFNTTLRTPLPPLGSLRSQVPPIPLAVRSISKASSVASRSTALTTTGYTASLRSRSSAESLSSAAVPAPDATSLAGTKRPLPASMTGSSTLKSRPRPDESSGPSKGTIRGKPAPKMPPKLSIKPATTLPRSARGKSGDVAVEDSQTASAKTDEESAGDRKGSSHTTKRRKVVSSSFRAGHLNRAVRPKTTARGSAGLSATSRTQAVKPGNEVSHRSTHPLSASSAKT